MNRFTSAKEKPKLLYRVLSAAAISGCAIAFFLHGISSVSDKAEESHAESLRLAILRSAVHCYAMEGRYPESLDYLKEHYGITWDEERYVVDYEITGSNLRPDVTIIPLAKKEAAS